MAEENVDVVIDDKGAILQEITPGEDQNKVNQQLADEKDDHEEETDEEREEREEEERIAASEAEERRSEGNADVSDDEREAIRKRRREEKQRRKEFSRQKRDQDTRYTRQLEEQVTTLTTRMQALESRQTGSDLARLDAAIEAAQQDEQLYEQAMMEALVIESAPDRARQHTIATKAWHEAKRKSEELTALKQRVTQGQRQAMASGGASANVDKGGGAAQPALPPEARNYAKKFISQHRWYGGRSAQDRESTRVAIALDAQLVEEGWDPTTREYWAELADRVKDRLPERFQGRQNGASNGQRGRGMRQITGSGGQESQAGGSTQGFLLSADRVNAIKEAGKWDDPNDRAKMIKHYKEWDAQNPKANR